jgi:hypothetical protein
MILAGQFPDWWAYITAPLPAARSGGSVLGFALDTRQNHGVWGGMSEQERRLRARKTCTGT